MKSLKPIPLYKRLKWHTDHHSHHWVDKRGEVALHLYHIRGTSWRVSSGTLEEIITASSLLVAKRKAVSVVQRFVRNAASKWEVR